MERAPKFEGRPVWAEISLGAIQRNFRRIRRHIGRGRKILSVVKGNAYGHGAVPVSKALAKAGSDWFGVTSTAEGIELREAGIRQPILLLTGFWPGEERRILRYRLTPVVTEITQLHLLERAARRVGRRLDFHLKVDTGMSRLGIAPSAADAFLAALADCPHLRLGGTMTHFASSEVFTNTQTEAQLRVFLDFVARLRAAGLHPGLLHLANSAAIASRPETWGDMVRPGALLYGYHQRYDPPERLAEVCETLPLEPALSLRARIVSLRDLPAGVGIGYNARFVTDRPSRIAVIPAGYADGLVRQLSNTGRVIVRGRCVPIVGIVSMDLTTIDVTDVPGVRLGDVVTIFGRQGPLSRSPFDVAAEIGTVTSDLLCALGSRVPRFYRR
ncbi:MAG: alanine racemase [Firmicutes bacterium]|nr:alanine racemase [Bacillota bacterium]